LSYAADKQTDSKILPTPTDIVALVGVGNNVTHQFTANAIASSDY